ncbi:MAG: hypothetical protein R8F63_13290 [Acidimicrobiales bacterium]|nr:hypothetical protein [Acidimicrobiales bacterium]
MPALTETPGTIEPERDYVVVVTRLTVRNPITALAFLRTVPAVRRQLRAADGVIHHGLLASLLRLQFSTFAVFESRRHLTAFVGAGAHRDVMRRLRGRFRLVEARTGVRRGDRIPRDWPAIHSLLTESDPVAV